MIFILPLGLIFDTKCSMEAKDYISQAVKKEGVEVIAARAGVSRATVFRVLAGGNARMKTILDLLAASGKRLQVRPNQPAGE
jgi:DNA-binding phage protein